MLWAVLFRSAAAAAVGCLCCCSANGTESSQRSADVELERAIAGHQNRMEECSGSKYAQEGNQAAMTAEVVRQTTARLAKEQPGVSLQSHFQSKAVAFEMEENANKILMETIIKKRPQERDLPALRFADEEAAYKGFVHRELPKAARVLAWEASAADVVLDDQAAALASRKCDGVDGVCPLGSFPLVNGCEVATCVHVSGGADNPSALAKKEALGKAVPALQTAMDLKQFNKVVKGITKERKKASTACNDAIKHLLNVGERDRVDLPALRFFVELAQHEGFRGRSTNDGTRLLEQHMAKVVQRGLEISRLVQELAVIRTHATSMEERLAVALTKIGELTQQHAQHQQERMDSMAEDRGRKTGGQEAKSFECETSKPRAKENKATLGIMIPVFAMVVFACSAFWQNRRMTRDVLADARGRDNNETGADAGLTKMFYSSEAENEAEDNALSLPPQSPRLPASSNGDGR